MSDTVKIVAKNKKAFHDYFVEDKFETGIELKGSEVKSIRAGKVNLKDSWCSIVKGEIFVNGLHISVYEQGAIWCKDPLRARKLLMHKKEIMKLLGQTQQQGYSIIPLSMYFKGNRIKLEIGLCKGKKLYDKRSDMAKKSAKRTIERELKERNFR